MKLVRYAHNPILEANPEREWESGAVFNCGATVSADGSIYLLYRAIPEGYTKKPGGAGYDDYVSSIGCAISEDGYHLTRFAHPVIEPLEEYERFGCEDPRVTRLEIGGRVSYLVTYTALSTPAFYGARHRVALASTEDLHTFHKHGVVILDLEDKDAVIFPELIGGRIAMLHRVTPNIQIVYFDSLEQLTNPREDFWNAHQAALEEATVMWPKYKWEAKKIGAGPPPLRTDAGWLLIYHGVDAAHVYRAGAALLDLEEPSRVIARSPYPILEPQEEYERVGDVPNVVFPEGAIVRDGVLYVYYGGADKCCCLATIVLDDLLGSLLAFRE
ncbi:MAG: glycosidase [Chloroflexota bacterium]|nr:glycosidase [Chloroflexota bacterium]